MVEGWKAPLEITWSNPPCSEQAHPEPEDPEQTLHTQNSHHPPVLTDLH